MNRTHLCNEQRREYRICEVVFDLTTFWVGGVALNDLCQPDDSRAMSETVYEWAKDFEEGWDPEREDYLDEVEGYFEIKYAEWKLTLPAPSEWTEVGA